MPLLQLQIDIDSDVQPELHAMLASVVRGAARAERLRQLAAAGLIWEHLRVHARPVPLAASEPPPQPAATAAPGPPAAALPATATATAATTAAAPRRAPADAIPVLWDAVEEAALPPSVAVAAVGDGSRVESAPDEPARTGTGRDVAVPASRKSGTRSRLLRMKEKGLFQNGQDN